MCYALIDWIKRCDLTISAYSLLCVSLFSVFAFHHNNYHYDAAASIDNLPYSKELRVENYVSFPISAKLTVIVARMEGRT